MDQASDDQSFRSAMLGAGRSFVAAIAARDASAAAVAYARSARLLAPSVEPIEGRDAIAAFWRAGIEAGIRGVQQEPVQLERRGPVAFESGRYAIRLEPDEGGPLVERGKYVLVHELHTDGSWQRVVEMLCPDGPPEAPALPQRDNREEVAGD
jgi:ketosteroid isomerase-like protein